MNEAPRKPWRIMLIGPPGCGKGTQSSMLQQSLNVPHLSTGEMLREEVEEKTSLGLKAQKIMERGDLVGDDIVLGLIEKAILSDRCRDGFILDGFPRTLAQAEGLSQLLNEHQICLDAIIVFSLSLPDLIERISGRLVHPSSGRIYHTTLHPPKRAGLDDITGEPLTKRKDDTEDKMRIRYNIFQTQTQPIIDYYKPLYPLRTFDASSSAQILHHQILEFLSSQRTA